MTRTLRISCVIVTSEPILLRNIRHVAFCAVFTPANVACLHTHITMMQNIEGCSDVSGDREIEQACFPSNMLYFEGETK